MILGVSLVCKIAIDLWLFKVLDFCKNLSYGLKRWLRVKSIHGSCRGPGVSFQHSYSGSQQAVTPVPGVPVPSLASMGTECIWCINQMKAKHPYIKKNQSKNFQDKNLF